jgi:hypothetical protein
MPTDDSPAQVDLRKILSAVHSAEVKKNVEGIIDHTITLTVAGALEIIRTCVVQAEILEFLTDLTMYFLTEHCRACRKAPDINASEVYRRVLVKYLTLQSMTPWTAVFGDSVAFAAAASINRQPDTSGVRQKPTFEELIDDDEE